MHSLSRTSGGLNSPERAVRRRRWKSFIVLGCVPFSSAHKRAGRGDKKRNSGNTRGELLPKSCSLASRCQAKTLVVSSRNPTAALRVLESDRPPGRRLKASHYVCVPRPVFFCLCFVVVKRRIRVTIARGHHTTAQFYASACACSVGISCVCRSSAALFLASAVCVITHIFTCALGAEAAQVPTITLRARRFVGVSLAPMPQRSAQAIVVEK
jgi:hypothetical protein